MALRFIWHVNKVLIVLISFLTSISFASDGLDFQKTKIRFGHLVVNVELAKSPQQQARGLMFRKKLEDNTGMLFIYNEEQPLSFWMKNTFIPLSIGFFDKNRTLVDAKEMEPVTSEAQLKIPTYQASRPAMYALEMPSGWFKKNKIKLGAQFSFVDNK